MVSTILDPCSSRHYYATGYSCRRIALATAKTVKPSLHDTTCCHKGCQTGLTTGCIVYTAGCQTGCTTRFDKPVDNRLDVCLHDTAGCQPVLSSKRGIIFHSCFFYLFLRPQIFRRPWADFRQALPHDAVCCEIDYVLWGCFYAPKII